MSAKRVWGFKALREGLGFRVSAFPGLCLNETVEDSEVSAGRMPEDKEEARVGSSSEPSGLSLGLYTELTS